MVKETKLSKQEFIDKYEVSPSTKCICCGDTAREMVERGDVDWVQNAQPCDAGWLCYACYEQDSSEPGATVVYSENPEEPARIGSYFNETNGEFTLEWIRSDAWRGHYDVKSEVYRMLHTDCILSMSADAEELEKFDKKLQELCDKQNVRYARVFTRTSNLFSQGYDFFVHKDDFKDATQLLLMMTVVSLRSEYRDSERFSLTALTGKDTFDEKDRLFAKAAEKIMAGEDFDDVKEFVKEEVQKEAEQDQAGAEQKG